jgi:hypothetical protein
MELSWTDTTISGKINPGETDEAVVKVGKLDSSNWTVHLEGEGKDEKGSPLRTIIDGKLDNLGSSKRTLTGTWTRGTAKGNVKLTRE